MNQLETVLSAVEDISEQIIELSERVSLIDQALKRQNDQIDVIADFVFDDDYNVNDLNNRIKELEGQYEDLESILNDICEGTCNERVAI